jgi:uncharacterized protein YjdB
VLSEATFLGTVSVCFNTVGWNTECVDHGPAVGTPSVAVAGVSVTPGAATVAVTGTVRLSATVTPNDATDKTVEWASSNATVASVDTIGLVTGVGAGTATIIATTRSGGKTAQTVITVTGPPPSGPADPPGPSSPVPTDPPAPPPTHPPGPPPTDPPSSGVVVATGLSVSPVKVKLQVGQTAAISVALAPIETTDQSVVWTISNPTIATVTEQGTVRGVKPGKTTVTVSNGSLAASTAVTVVKTKPKLQTKLSRNLKTGTAIKLKVKVIAAGVALGGKIRVTLTHGKTKNVTTIALRPRNNNKYVTIRLPKPTHPGTHKLTIAYLGTSHIATTKLTKKLTIK